MSRASSPELRQRNGRIDDLERFAAKRLCRTMTRCASNHPTTHQITENKAKVPLTKRAAMGREMPRSEAGGSGAYVSPESAKRMKKVTNDQPTIRQAGYGLQSIVRCTVDSKSSSIHQSMTPPTMRRRQPMPNHKLGLISPTIGLAIIAALPTPESR